MTTSIMAAIQMEDIPAAPLAVGVATRPITASVLMDASITAEEKVQRCMKSTIYATRFFFIRNPLIRNEAEFLARN